MKGGPVGGFQLNDGDPVGFGAAERFNRNVSAEFAGLQSLGGEGARFLSNAGRGLGFHWFGGWLGQGKRPSVIHLEKSSGQLLGRQVANLANWLDRQEFALLSKQQVASPSFRSPEVCVEFRWI